MLLQSVHLVAAVQPPTSTGTSAGRERESGRTTQSLFFTSHRLLKGDMEIVQQVKSSSVRSWQFLAVIGVLAK